MALVTNKYAKTTQNPHLSLTLNQKAQTVHMCSQDT